MILDWSLLALLNLKYRFFSAQADTTKHDDPIKCYVSDISKPDELGTETDCPLKTCLKSVSPDGKIVARSCSPTHEDNERCDSPNGGKMCYCNSNLCNSSANFKVNYVAIFGILAMFHLLK